MIFIHKSELILEPAESGLFQTIFRTDHGRKVYLRLQIADEYIYIVDCFYIDRPQRDGRYPVPLRLKTTACSKIDLLQTIYDELDKEFCGTKIVKSGIPLSPDEYIRQKILDDKKYRLLILIGKPENDILPEMLETRLKNRVHRSIYMKLRYSGKGKGIIEDCYYYDRKYKRSGIKITPQGLTSIYLEYNSDSILKIVNAELNCDFTHVIITDDTIGFHNSDVPICGNL